MVSKKKNKKSDGNEENDDGGVAEYEQSREQRIKANLQRMQQLGIFDLSRTLKSKPIPKPKPARPPKPLPPSSGSPRRSSRIKTIPAVSYTEKRIPKEIVVKEVKIAIEEGSKPEVYTEEHEKVLGDHKETWILYEDGFDSEGNRMYDAYDGKSCHQCRQKTLGRRTKCCKCTSVRGQFCGDCLFMRYGENVIEANANPDWVCPVCRDICNCSRCRKIKGWQPTGNLYRKVLQLGFKSVAHYLIHTRGPHGKQDGIDNETNLSETDKEDELLDDNVGNMDEDSKHVPSEKITKAHDHGQQSKGDNDDDADPDYKSDSHDDNDDGADDNDDEDYSS